MKSFGILHLICQQQADLSNSIETVSYLSDFLHDTKINMILFQCYLALCRRNLPKTKSFLLQDCQVCQTNVINRCIVHIYYLYVTQQQGSYQARI